MGRKKKNRAEAQGSNAAKSAPKSPRSTYVLLSLAIGVALLVLGGFFLFQRQKSETLADRDIVRTAAQVSLRETRATLSPELFTGKAKRTYAIAREIPEIIDQVYCYCECQRFGHKSLLSCFVDEHASV